MSKHFPVNPLEPVTEKKLCSEKISKISLYWCDNFEKISYDAIARAQIAFTAVQPLNELGLALCIFDELGCCAFASPHAPFESESSGGGHRSWFTANFTLVSNLPAAGAFRLKFFSGRKIRS